MPVLRAFALVLCCAWASAALAEKRVALIVGNGAYANAPALANPPNDARALAAKLRGLGFETVEGYDLDRAGMVQALYQFAELSADSDINLFFYAGHGMSVDGVNYLVPVDATLEKAADLRFKLVTLDAVTSEMSYSEAVNLVFLDACRDNPLSRSLSRSMKGSTRAISISQGLSEVQIDNPGAGLAIAFATSPGEVALDGEGEHSPFTAALLRHIDAPGADIAEVFSRVTGDVYESTERRQRPWLNTSLTGPVSLNPAAPEAAAPSPEPLAIEDRTAHLEEQKLLFDLARESGAAEDYQGYLDLFPNGLYASIARRNIEAAREKEAPVAVASAEQPSAASRRTVIGGVAPSSGAAFSNAAAAFAPDGLRPATRSIPEFGPLVLSVTPVVASLPANEATEAALDLDRQKRGEIQSRLNAAGASVGKVDGLWGQGTRRGVMAWQQRNGVMSTGYFNAAQLELLTSQTEGLYEPFTVPVARTQRPSAPARSAPAPAKSKADGPDATMLGRFVGGVIRGITD